MQFLNSATLKLRLVNVARLVAFASVGLAGALAVPTLARADYLYEYTGNVFTFSRTEQVEEYSPDGYIYYYPRTETFQTYLTATILSPTLLTSGSVSNSTIQYSITAHQEFQAPLVLSLPYNPEFPEYAPAIGGFFNIGAVGANNLPTQWNIDIRQYQFVGGRAHEIVFSTTNNLDSYSGYDEPYVVFSGSLVNNPGSWKVSVVPEPESYAMLLAGLALIGYSVRRHKANIKS